MGHIRSSYTREKERRYLNKEKEKERKIREIRTLERKGKKVFETRKKRRIRTLERKRKKVFEQGRREGECERVIRFNDGA